MLLFQHIAWIQHKLLIQHNALIQNYQIALTQVHNHML